MVISKGNNQKQHLQNEAKCTESLISKRNIFKRYVAFQTIEGTEENVMKRKA